jgi:hypothetical protein
MAQGSRLARVARVIARAQLEGILDVRSSVVAEAVSRAAVSAPEHMERCPATVGEHAPER